MGKRHQQYMISTSPVVRGMLEMSCVAYGQYVLQEDPEDAPHYSSRLQLANVMVQTEHRLKGHVLDTLMKALPWTPGAVDLFNDPFDPSKIPDGVLDQVVADTWTALAVSLFQEKE